MGGILLIGALVGIYLIAYWSIYIEEENDKTKGFLGFVQVASATLHGLEQFKQKSFLGKKSSLSKPQEAVKDQASEAVPKKKKSFLKKKKP